MILSDSIKTVVESSPFITLVTLGLDGNPHPIIVGKGSVTETAIIFGIYKMEITQKNLTVNPNAWIVAATKDGGPKGYRLSGTAVAEGKELIFTPVKEETLI